MPFVDHDETPSLLPLIAILLGSIPSGYDIPPLVSLVLCAAAVFGVIMFLGKPEKSYLGVNGIIERGALVEQCLERGHLASAVDRGDGGDYPRLQNPRAQLRTHCALCRLSFRALARYRRGSPRGAA